MQDFQAVWHVRGLAVVVEYLKQSVVLALAAARRGAASAAAACTDVWRATEIAESEIGSGPLAGTPSALPIHRARPSPFSLPWLVPSAHIGAPWGRLGPIFVLWVVWRCWAGPS